MDTTYKDLINPAGSENNQDSLEPGSEDYDFNNKKFTCNICYSQFNSAKGLKQHRGKVHLKAKKNIECPTCTKKFETKYALKYHIKHTHDMSCRIKCPYCGKELYNKYSLKRHKIICVMNQ